MSSFNAAYEIGRNAARIHRDRRLRQMWSSRPLAPSGKQRIGRNSVAGQDYLNDSERTVDDEYRDAEQRLWAEFVQARDQHKGDELRRLGLKS